MINGIEIKLVLYADDLVLTGETVEGLQRSLSVFEKYTKEKELEVNIEKAEIIYQNGKICRLSKIATFWED